MCMGGMGIAGRMIKKRLNSAKPLGANDNQKPMGRNIALGGGDTRNIGGGSGTLLGGFSNQGSLLTRIQSSSGSGGGGRSTGGGNGGRGGHTPYYDER